MAPDREWWEDFAESVGGELVETREGWTVQVAGGIDPDDLVYAMEEAGLPDYQGRMHIGFGVLREEEDGETEADWIPASFGASGGVAWEQAVVSAETWERNYEGTAIVSVSVRFF